MLTRADFRLTNRGIGRPLGPTLAAPSSDWAMAGLPANPASTTAIVNNPLNTERRRISYSWQRVAALEVCLLDIVSAAPRKNLRLFLCLGSARLLDIIAFRRHGTGSALQYLRSWLKRSERRGMRFHVRSQKASGRHYTQASRSGRDADARAVRGAAEYR